MGRKKFSQNTPPGTKQCSKCLDIKLLEAFTVDTRNPDGRGARCRTCQQVSIIAWQKRNPERCDAIKAKCRRNTRQKISAYTKQSRQANPLKYKARTKLYNEMIAGRVKRLPCAVCGVERTQAHHEDYSKPLDVVWLCPKHHAEIHKNKRVA